MVSADLNLGQLPPFFLIYKIIALFILLLTQRRIETLIALERATFGNFYLCRLIINNAKA
jgi:hypothetical protein